MLDFVKPRTSYPLLTIAKILWPLYIVAKYRRLRFELSPEVGEAFERLRRKRVVICPNHSHKLDPDALFGVSRIVRLHFYFLAAREIFGAYRSRKYRWMQKLGCFSVERGAADIQAVKAIHDLLLEEETKMVIFPEGEVSHQNDYLMNLEDGVERIALTTLKDLRKKQPESTIYILPLILKYRFSKNVWPDILNNLARAEAHLELKPTESEPIYVRLRNCLNKGLDRLEERHGITAKSDDLETRLSNMRERLIDISQDYLKVKLPADAGQVTRLHILRNSFAHNQFGDYMDLELSEEDDVHYQELRLATHMVAIGEHSFKESMDQEDAAELVNLLEEAIYGRVSLRLPDIVKVGTGKEIDVGDYLKQFETKKALGVQALKEELSGRMKKRNLEFETNYQNFIST